MQYIQYTLPEVQASVELVDLFSSNDKFRECFLVGINELNADKTSKLIHKEKADIKETEYFLNLVEGFYQLVKYEYVRGTANMQAHYTGLFAFDFFIMDIKFFDDYIGMSVAMYKYFKGRVLTRYKLFEALRDNKGTEHTPFEVTKIAGNVVSLIIVGENKYPCSLLLKWRITLPKGSNVDYIDSAPFYFLEV